MANGELYSLALEATDIATDLGEEEILNQVKGNLSFIKNAAAIFVSRTSSTIIKINNINEAARLKQSLKNPKNMDNQDMLNKFALLKKVTIETSEFRSFMSDVFDFQTVLNEYLGQKIEMVYVYRGSDGKNPILYRIQGGGNEIVKSMASKGRGLSARYKNFSKAFLDENGARYDSITEENRGEQYLTSAYNETITRGRYSKAVLHVGFLNLLWKPGNYWMRMKISAEGDVNEAYAAFYLNMLHKKYSFPKNSDIEQLLDVFLTHPTYGVAAVDNISGFLEGDVTIGDVEYAIKSRGATTLSYNQVVDFAVQLNQMSLEELSNDYIANFKQELHNQGIRRNIAEQVENSMDTDVDNILKSLMKK